MGRIREQTMKPVLCGWRVLLTICLLVCSACGQTQKPQVAQASSSSQPIPSAQTSPSALPSRSPQTYASVVTPAPAQAPANRSEEVLRAARTALGGEEKLRSVHSLSVAGEVRRAIQGGNMQSGDIKLEFLLPDKFLRTQTMNPFGGLGVGISFLTGLDGSNAWVDSRSNNADPNVTMVRRPDMQASREQLLKLTRAEFTRYLLGLLLTPPPSQPLEFTFAGEEQTPDGSADMLEATGPDGFAVRLFFDQRSHLLLMMSYRGAAQRMTINRQQSTGRASSEKEAKKIAEAARKKPPDAPPSGPREESEIQMRLSDYHAVDGILLPRHITRTVDKKVEEEWNLQTIKVNPPLKPGRFRK